MNINIVLAGANGRMGRTIHSMLVQNKAFHIAGLVVHPSELESARAHLGGTASTDMEKTLSGVSNPVIIDFTAPEVSLNFARIAAKIGARQVIGTTGLNEQQRAELAELAKKTPIFWSPNMSVGINVLLKILPDLVKSLGQEYDVEIMEIHHKKKKESPSGTAVRLGEVLAQAKGWNLGDSACYHREGIIGERPERQIGLQTLRGGDVVGVHTIYFMGPGERIELTHQAHSRENFAGGALRAAKWLAGKPAGKLYSMQDVLLSQ
jgi:4-hydroxy-tetrahydrodipicolinate reductase